MTDSVSSRTLTPWGPYAWSAPERGSACRQHRASREVTRASASSGSPMIDRPRPRPATRRLPADQASDKSFSSPTTPTSAEDAK